MICTHIVGFLYSYNRLLSIITNILQSYIICYIHIYLASEILNVCISYSITKKTPKFQSNSQTNKFT